VSGVAEGGTADDEAVRVQALKGAKGVNFLPPVFRLMVHRDAVGSRLA
jgi:hypothetical protein